MDLQMITLQGQVLNIFRSDDYKNAKTGEVTLGRSRVQILGEIHLESGDVQMQIFELSLPERFKDEMQEYKGHVVRFEIGVGATATGKVYIMMAQKAHIVLVK
ncbi:hypothetical protein [Methylomonas sp. HYX-M1]|uniref:hypothetical protein n=1 Tax=Methylomonas sp. HYX-M1 TaxID=3139307 RepID=UPI00345C3AAB